MLKAKPKPNGVLKNHSAHTHSYLIAALLIAVLMQQIRNLLHIDSIIEWRSITNLSLVGRHFALQTLDEMTDGHT